MPRRPSKTEGPGEFTLEHDSVSEGILIAAALTSRELRSMLVGKFTIDYFFERTHKKIWEAIAELERKHIESSIESLQILGEIDDKYVRKLLDLNPTPPKNLELFIDRMYYDFARLTATHNGGPLSQLVEAVNDPLADPARVKSLARSVVDIFDDYRDDSYLPETEDLIVKMRREWENAQSGEAIFPFGIPRLDYYVTPGEDGNPIPRMVPGAAPEKVTLVVGNSGIGKSTVVARMVLGIARQYRYVLYGAWEETSASTLQLLACMSLNYDRDRLVLPADKGGLTEEEFEKMCLQARAIGKYVRFLDVPFSRKRGEKSKTNDKNLDIVQEHISRAGPDVFVADLFQRCLVQTRPEEEAQALFRIQAMAKEQQCHMLLVHQARLKDTETRSDKRTTREGIKGTSAWVDIPDTILGIHRAGSYKQLDDNTLEIDVLKLRKGKWPQAIEFQWDPKTALITGGREIPYDAMNESKTMEDYFDTETRRKKRSTIPAR